ncbi:MAG: hypothetical protein Q9191_004044 [Dirinaria sp. TL-2023a]
MAEGLFNENFDFDSYVALQELFAEAAEAPEAPDRAPVSATNGEVFNESFAFANYGASEDLFVGFTEARDPAAISAAAYPAVPESTPSTNENDKRIRKVRPEGDIRRGEKGLEFRENSDEDWESAVFHHDIWDELLAQADAHAVQMGGFTVFLDVMGQGCIDANNTSSFGRDLSDEEMKTLKKAIDTHKAQIKANRGNNRISAAPQQHQRAKSPTGSPHPPSSTTIAGPSSLTQELEDTSHDTGEKRPHEAVSMCKDGGSVQSSPKKARK